MIVFRLIGDQLHLFAFFLLLIKIIRSQSCAGISGKTQFLLALECTTRYLDLFFSFYSTYNTSMKILYILITYFTLLLIYVVYRKTYEHEHDTCRIEYLVLPAIILALLVNYEFNTLEIFWTFSIYIEVVALIPQFMFISKKGEYDGVVLIYLCCMVSSRSFFYILNWVYRYYDSGYFNIIATSAAVVEGFVCAYFFIRCVYTVKRKKAYHRNLELILNGPENNILNEKLINDVKPKSDLKDFYNYFEEKSIEIPAVHNNMKQNVSSS